MDSLKRKVWWEYLEHDLQELISESFVILDMTRKFKDQIEKETGERFHDNSFIIFPAAKAYEGFLKKVFLDLGFISQDDYFGKHFRIGMALNPSLPTKLQKHGVYKKIIDHCGGVELADYLWETWKLSRNYTFHWFPNEKNVVSIDEAEERIHMIVNAIDRVFTECKL